MPHAHDVDRFNRMAESYERHWLQSFVLEPVQRTVMELAATSVAGPAAILDVGCGTGRLLRKAEQRFPNARLVGVDAAPEMLKKAQASLPNGSSIRFQQAVAENLPFADAQFDVVFSTLTFHHWQEQTRGISEVARVLTPGGRWLVAEVMPRGVIGGVLRIFRMNQFPEPQKFEAMLSKAGMKRTGERRVPGLGGQLNVVAAGS
jgi:ubiquinone/menaquinone biosynthesis C-methylase UbiE